MQEFCKAKEAALIKRIEEVKETEGAKLTRSSVEVLLDEILSGFTLRQPSEYFVQNPTDDTECILRI